MQMQHGWFGKPDTNPLVPIDDVRGRYPANVIAEEGCVLPADRMRYFNLSLWAKTHGICDTPKASRKEKEAGLFESVVDNSDKYQGKFPNSKADKTVENKHPTCKPLTLMSWLIALGSPEDGLVLDLFMGTGTTLIAAHLNGMRGLGIEREWKWCDIARRRLEHWTSQPKQLGLMLDNC